eukprot:962727-Rhodomonas_salina.1
MIVPDKRCSGQQRVASHHVDNHLALGDAVHLGRSPLVRGGASIDDRVIAVVFEEGDHQRGCAVPQQRQ